MRIGWYISISVILFLVFLLWWANGITSKREIPEEDEYDLTGVINVKANSDVSPDNDDGLRSKFDGESG